MDFEDWSICFQEHCIKNPENIIHGPRSLNMIEWFSVHFMCKTILWIKQDESKWFIKTLCKLLQFSESFARVNWMRQMFLHHS